MKAYNITVERADSKEISGYSNSGVKKSMVVISTDQVSRIEIRRMDYGLMVLAGSILVVAIIYEGIIFPIAPY